jgi:hypothetical protein
VPSNPAEAILPVSPQLDQSELALIKKEHKHTIRNSKKGVKLFFLSDGMFMLVVIVCLHEMKVYFIPTPAILRNPRATAITMIIGNNIQSEDAPPVKLPLASTIDATATGTNAPAKTATIKSPTNVPVPKPAFCFRNFILV